jgi:uncharacterized protein (TIRG00374 family)
MSDSHWLRRRWKLIVNVLTLLALTVLVVALREQVIDVFQRIDDVKWWALLLLIPIQAFNYHAQTKMYQGLFSIVGNTIDYKKLLRVSLELNFVNNVFPSGGVSGISYFGLRLRGDNVTGARATLVQLMKLGMLFLSFELLVIFGLFILAWANKVNGLVILLAGSLSTVMVLGTFGFVYIIGSKPRINSFFTALTMGLNKIVGLVLKNQETINVARAREAFDDMHENYLIFKSKAGELKSPFWWAFWANFAEVLAIYAVYVAFGEWVNLGAIILAYAIANFAGFISVLPGGVGVYEALMTGVLVIAGVPAALSIPVVVMYRVLNTGIQLPPGFYYYHKALQDK